MISTLVEVEETGPLVLHRKKAGRFLFVVETAELLNIFVIILMALFLNAQGRAELPVQIFCLLMNRRVFQTFDVLAFFLFFHDVVDIIKGVQEKARRNFCLTQHVLIPTQSAIGLVGKGYGFRLSPE